MNDERTHKKRQRMHLLDAPLLITPASRATERFIILGDDADKHLFHAPVGWVDDPKCAVGFMRRDAAAITRWRLAAQGRGKITNVRVERVA